MKLHVHYDKEADYLEFRFGRKTVSYFEELGNDVFVRKSESNDEIRGYAIFNIKRRSQLSNISFDVPISTQ